jgi:uncharacterized protein YndB with AHSA1/START domain
MTRARALKQIIRARAAKTGERYTTARRHVLRDLQVQRPPAAAPPVAVKASANAPAPKGEVSDAKAREKTGHGLDHWFAVLDAFGGVSRGHTALARHLFADHGVPSWHCQGITVAYERAHGARAVNQRCDGEYEVSISKILRATPRDVARALTEPRRRTQWAAGVDAELVKALGRGLGGGSAKGVIVRPDGQGRFRYKWGETAVQGMLLPKAGGKLSLVVTHGKLPDAAAVARQRVMWRTALEALARFVSAAPARTRSRSRRP